MKERSDLDISDHGLKQVRAQKISSITGQLLLMAITVCFFYAVLFFVLKIYLLAEIVVCILVFAIISRIVWVKGYVYYSRFFLIILGNAFVFILSGSLGSDSGLARLYFPLICATFILYNVKELVYIIVALILTFTGLIILEIFDYSIIPIPMPSALFMHITHVFSAILSLLIAIYCIYSMQVAGDDAETTLEDAKDEIKRNLSKIESKNKELEQFVYIASHDLQEPVRTVANFTQLLSREYGDKFNDVAKQSIDFILEATTRMTLLIKGLLDYSRIGKDPEARMVDVNEMLKSVISDMHSTISETGSRIHAGALPALKVYVTEFRLLFQNLVSNAIKFRKAGVMPEINISAARVNNEWRFCVKDNGIGIDPKYKEKIFVIFQRLNNRTDFEGTGIGLAHCKKIVDLHNGRIWVESQPGIGSTFYFTLNLPD